MAHFLIVGGLVTAVLSAVVARRAYKRIKTLDKEIVELRAL